MLSRIGRVLERQHDTLTVAIMAYQWLYRGLEWLYSRGARLYDPLVWLLFGSAWREWQTCALEDIAGECVLELGCGTGALSALLQPRARLVIGIDRSRAMLRQARRKQKAAVYLCADARALPLRSGTCSAILCTFPSGYILDPETANEVARVLSPGGNIVVVVAAKLTSWHPRYWPIRLLQRVLQASPATLLHMPALLNHPMLQGAWQHRTTPTGIVYVWIGTRIPEHVLG